MTTAIICHYDNFPLRRVNVCPTCKQRRRIAGADRGAWSGVIWTCCGCGDQWADGKMLERPFRPRWRRENIAAAKVTWDEAGQYTAADHSAWVREQLGEVTS